MKILISSENFEIIQLITRILKKPFTPCETVSSRNETETARLILHYEPDLVILDSDLIPDRTAFGRCENVRRLQEFPPIKILFIGWHIPWETQKQIASLGNIETLSKPFHSRELIEKIKNLFQGRKSF